MEVLLPALVMGALGAAVGALILNGRDVDEEASARSGLGCHRRRWKP